MAYDSSKPANGGSLVSADIRENFRALKEDGIVVAEDLVAAKKDPIAATAGLRTLGTGAQQAMPGNTSLIPVNSSVSQAKLKTSTGSVSLSSSTSGTVYTNLILPGGGYGFYPQIELSVSSLWTDMIVASMNTYIAKALPYSMFINNAFITNICLELDTNHSVPGTAYAYAQQRYVTSSGEVHWVFILRDKTTKDVISMYQAPDHPCFGNSGKPLLVPHPFGSYDPEKHEIIVINPSDEEVFNMQDACVMPEDKPDRDILEVIVKDYEIDEDLKTYWPKKEITVGLPKNIDWKRMPEDSKVVPVRKRIPQPSYVTTRKLWKKK